MASGHPAGQTAFALVAPFAGSTSDESSSSNTLFGMASSTLIRSSGFLASAWTMLVPNPDCASKG